MLHTLCGRHAVLAALHHRGDRVERLYFAKAQHDAVRPFLRGLAQRRVPFRELPDDELDRVAHSRAHQGLVAVLPLPETPLTTAVLWQAWAKAPGPLLALDGVGNPHNLGAIARTAAFLGVRDLVLAEEGAASIRSTAAYRTAEGGLESLAVWRSSDLARDLGLLQAAGGLAVALAVGGTLDLATLRQRGPRGLVLVAGAEEDGLRPAVAQACRAAVRIEGTDAVQSLNVGVAVGMALSWLVTR